MSSAVAGWSLAQDETINLSARSGIQQDVEQTSTQHGTARPAPRAADDWLALARRLAAEGQHRAAAHAATRALCLDPDLPPAHHQLGSSLLALGATEEAIPALRRAQRLAPEIRYYRYELLDGLGRLDMDGTDPEVHRDLLDCLEREGIDPCRVRELAARFLLSRPDLRRLAGLD